MGDRCCPCVCHRDRHLAGVHVCGCTSSIVEDATPDWYTAAVERFKAQAEMGANVAAMMVERARGTCPHCERVLDVNLQCPAGCLDLDGIEQAPHRVPAVSGSKLHRGRH